MCKRTCNNCGEIKDQCIDHSSICEIRAAGFFKKGFCGKDENKELCPFSCGECVAAEKSK